MEDRLQVLLKSIVDDTMTAIRTYYEPEERENLRIRLEHNLIKECRYGRFLDLIKDETIKALEDKIESLEEDVSSAENYREEQESEWQQNYEDLETEKDKYKDFLEDVCHVDIHQI